jgi:ribosomal protein S18 acetylase RimI-like enzyme
VQIALRPARAEDQDFCYLVYASTRTEELADVPWDDATKDAFLLSQARAQDTDYRARRPDAEFLVIAVDGHDVGRLYRTELPDDELRLMDIALLPEFRGRGIGTQLIADLVAEADQRGLLLSLHVEHHNPVRRLYDRLGFVVAGSDEVNARMERRPS